MTWIKPFVAERDALNDRVAAHGAAMISKHLKALNARYHRHTFKFVQGMGTQFLTVSPDLFSYGIIGDGWQSIPPDARGRAGLVFFMKQYDAIMAVAYDAWDELNIEIGDAE